MYIKTRDVQQLLLVVHPRNQLHMHGPPNDEPIPPITTLNSSSCHLLDSSLYSLGMAGVLSSFYEPPYELKQLILQVMMCSVAPPMFFKVVAWIFSKGSTLNPDEHGLSCVKFENYILLSSFFRA